MHKNEHEKVIRRDLYKKERETRNLAQDSETENATCSQTAVVRCNQWECYTLHVCLEKGDRKPLKDPSKS
jgi:hypothetical protein